MTDPVTAGQVGAPPSASPSPLNVSPAPNGGPAGVKQRTSPPSEFPIRLQLNITPKMLASLERQRRRMRLKQAIVARLGLMQWLSSVDPEYREDD
jgi:hypothetical protein